MTTAARIGRSVRITPSHRQAPRRSSSDRDELRRGRSDQPVGMRRARLRCFTLVRMDALSEALPLALSAAIYPPALLVMLLLLTGEHPRGLVLAYFVGAALMVVSAGLIALAALDGAGATSQDSRSASAGVQVAVGLALLVLAVWLWRRRARAPEQPAGDDQ